MFQKVNGTSGTNHAVTAVHGKFLSGTPRDKTKTTSAYVEFETVDECNMAFKALRGNQGTDALGRPQKTVRMVVAAGAGVPDDATEAEAAAAAELGVPAAAAAAPVEKADAVPELPALPDLPALKKLRVADLKALLDARKMYSNGKKDDLVTRQGGAG